MTDHKGSHDQQKLSLDPLTFDEALAGLLATEPPAKAAKKTKAKTKRKRQSRKQAGDTDQKAGGVR